MRFFGNIRGNQVEAHQNPKTGVWEDWVYVKDNINIEEDPDRKCTRCGKGPTKEGHDHCIANLPNVEFACCGHGVEKGYVKLNNGKVIRFHTDLKRKEIIKLINERK